jgi:Flp pilus assembly protein TadD
LIQKRSADAEKQFTHALQINPADPQATQGLATVYIQDKNPGKAEIALKALAEQHPSSQSYTLLARFYAAQKRTKEAEATYQQAISKDPKDSVPVSELGMLYASADQVANALAKYQDALKLQPNNAGLWAAYGMLNERAGKIDEAKRAYQKALDIQPNTAVAANNLAWLMAEDGKDLDRALELARRAKLAAPQSPSVNDTLAWVYYKRQLFDSAVPLLQEAVKQSPEHAVYRFHLAAALNGQGKKEQAKSEMAKAVKLDPALKNRDDVKRVLSELSM